VVSTNHSFFNEAIPDVAEPNLSVYAWWDDLDVRTSGTIHYYDDAANNRFIVQYTNVPHYSGTPGVYTFQVILNASGTVLCQYLDMQQTLNSATLGIENADGSDGLQVAYNAAYMHNNLAILYSRGISWLTEAPTTGSVSPGDSMKVVVTFNSAGLTGGTYHGNLQFASNDYGHNPMTIPVSLGILVGVREERSGTPKEFALDQNYPNPFNPSTYIEYALPEGATLTLRLYDILGRQVRLLVSGEQDAGYYRVEWDGRGASGSQVASGVYFYRLEATSVTGRTYTSMKKMLMMK
jgi:hypothetical protein